MTVLFIIFARQNLFHFYRWSFPGTVQRTVGRRAHGRDLQARQGLFFLVFLFDCLHGRFQCFELTRSPSFFHLLLGFQLLGAGLLLRLLLFLLLGPTLCHPIRSVHLFDLSVENR